MALTVPDTFVPAVTAQPTQTPRQSAQFVQPIENHAPSLEEQIGSVVQAGGANLLRQGQDLGANLRIVMNDAVARNAETQFLSSATKIATDYTHTLGSDAIDGYDGAVASLAKAKQDVEGTLTNDLQRRNFNLVAAQHLTSFGKTLADHQFQQKVKFGADASNDRSDSMIQQAANNYFDWQRPDGKFALYKSQGITEALHGASLAGLPADSPQARQLVKDKTTELARGVLTRMMDNEQYDEAKTYFDKSLAAGEIDERVAESLGNAIMEGHTLQKAKDLATEVKQGVLGASDASQQRVPLIPGAAVGSLRVTDTMGSPRPGGRVHDGVDIAIPLGSKLQAPADGTVTKVWNDDKFGGGLSMEITYPNGTVEGVAHLGTVNYQPGQKVTQGSVIALSGQSGNATGPSVHWSMRDKDGAWIDPRAASPAAKDPSSFTDPNMLEQAIGRVNAEAGVTQRVKDSAINQLKNDYNTARGIESQKYAQVKGQAVDYYYQHNGSIDGLPAAVKMQLKPEDLFNMTRPPAVETDPDTMANFILKPETVTVDNVKSAYGAGKLNSGSYLSLLRDAMEMQSQPQKVHAVSMDNDQLDSILLTNGLQRLVNPPKNSPADQAESIQLRTAVRDQIDAEQTSGGKELTRQRKGEIMNQTIMQRTLPVYTPGAFSSFARFMVPFNFTDSTKPLAQLTPDQQQRAYVMVGDKQVRLASIPPAFRASAMSQLQRRRLPATEQDIANLWVKTGQGR